MSHLPLDRPTQWVRLQGFKSWRPLSSLRLCRFCRAEGRNRPHDPDYSYPLLLKRKRSPLLGNPSPQVFRALVRHGTFASPPGGARENCVLPPPAGPEWVWKPPIFPAPALR